MKKFSLDDFGVYIWTSNSLMHCVPAWAYLFNKFWPNSQKVTVLGYNLPDYELPENFNYVSLGTQRGPKYWSNDMKDYFQSCEHEIFYLTTEDGFIVDNVDKDIIEMAIKIAFLNPDDKFMRFNLTADVQSRRHEVLKSFEDYSLIKAGQRTVYRQSLQHSIWRKDSFLNKLIDNQSPWDFELDNKRGVMDGLDVYATRDKYAVYCGHGYKKGKKVENWYECGHKKFTNKPGLSIDDINYIEKNGWMPQI